MHYLDSTPVVLFSHTRPFFKNIWVKMLIDRLALRHKIFVDDFLAIKNANQHAFVLRLCHSYFLGTRRGTWRGSILWHLVSGSFSNTSNAPRSIKWGSFSIDSKKSGYFFLLMLFWCCVRFFGTIVAQIFLIPNSFKIWWKHVRVFPDYFNV